MNYSSRPAYGDNLKLLDNNSAKFKENMQLYKRQLDGMSSTELRMKALEKRIENSERLAAIFEETLNLKTDELENERKIHAQRENKLESRIKELEDKLEQSNKQKDQMEAKIKGEIGKLVKSNSKIEQYKAEIGEFYSTKIGELEFKLRNAQLRLEELIDKSADRNEVTLESKCSEIMGVIREISKSAEGNELKTIEAKEDLRNIHNDHSEFIELLKSLESKGEILNSAFEELKKLKESYVKILKVFENEEDNKNEGVEHILLENQES